MQLSKIISFPFILIGLYYLYMAFEYAGGDYAYSLIGYVLVLAVLYILSPQIDWWWYNKRPPRLPNAIRHLLETNVHFYQNLSPEKQTLFRNRMGLYRHAVEFMPQAMEEVPLDIQYAAAASVVTLTLNQEDFLLNKFEHIIAYPHPFPSPQHPEDWHTSEHFEEDGAILFSIEHLMKGFLESRKYFHTGLYEYARIYQTTYPDKNYPVLGKDIWPKIEAVSGFKREGIEKWIGLPEVDLYAICTVLYFVFPKKMAQLMPNVHTQLTSVFG